MAARSHPDSFRVLMVLFAVGIASVAMAGIGLELPAGDDVDNACLLRDDYPVGTEQSDNPLVGIRLSWFPLTFVCDYHREGGGIVSLSLTEQFFPTACLYVGGGAIISSMALMVAVRTSQRRQSTVSN